MTRLSDLQRKLSRTPLLTRVTSFEIDKMRREWPGLPDDYLGFLETIGFGNLEELQLYGGPVLPNSIYPQPKSDLSDILLFGDDFQGYCFGFDTSQKCALVDVDPQGSVHRRNEDGFMSLVESYFQE